MSDFTPPSPDDQTPPSGATPPPPPPPPAAAPYGQQQAGGVRPGELMDRFVAKLIDMLILVVVNMIVVTTVVVGSIFGGRGTLGFGAGGAGLLGGVVAAILTTAIYIGYFAFMESNQGRTVGKMVMKLKVEGPGGDKPTMEQAIKRNIWLAAGLLGIIPILGSILGSVLQLVLMIMIAVGINSDPINRQAWHDTFAGGTRVVKEG